MAYPVDQSARSQWGVEDSALREVPGSLKKLVPLQLNLPQHSKLPPARIIHTEVNNLPSGLRLRPAFVGRRSGLALSPAAAAGRIIHEDIPFVNNAGQGH